MSASDCKIIQLPKFSDPRGSLSFVQTGSHIAFPIRRVYYLYDVPSDCERGAHGHKALEQLMIPMAGSFDVEVDDGSTQRTFHLDDPSVGLYICPMIWRVLKNFSQGAVCVVLASLPYDEADYYRNYDDFLKDAKNAL